MNMAQLRAWGIARAGTEEKRANSDRCGVLRPHTPAQASKAVIGRKFDISEWRCSYPGPLAYRRSLITIDCSREGPTPMPEIGALQSSSIRFT